MNYGNIAAAVDYYQKHGYVYFPDAPWYVAEAAYYATRPTDSKDVYLADGPAAALGDPVRKFMVASGEQSFIQMMLDGQPLKQAICVTPCFRIERNNDWRRPYFMKAELINAHDVDLGHLVHLVHQAESFFEQFFSVRVVETGKNFRDEPLFDIVEKGTRVELGSYGIRRLEVAGRRIDWIYGTACAEPRLSTVQFRHNPGVR
jgi:hypothetical protein